MQRTQVLLEDWQYEALKAAAERRRRSVSSLVRDLVARDLQPGGGQPRRRLAEIRGIGADPQARGRDHDKYLYGKTRRDG
jgi:hypothetical protein